jgi:hypothetical protein
MPRVGWVGNKEGTLQRASHMDIFINVIPQLELVRHDGLKLGGYVGPTVSCISWLILAGSYAFRRKIDSKNR